MSRNPISGDLSELVDRSTAYGFAALMQPSLSMCVERTWRRHEKGNVTEAAIEGLTLVSRRYAATPEALNESQPVVTANVTLMYEGRVDNRQEIAYGLGLPKLAQAADGTVLAAAYEAWGAELSAKVIGEYAYVVFDARSRQLVAGQDSLGIRRLFYGLVGDRLVVTSNLRLLFERFPELRPGYDRDVLREYFTCTMAPWSGRTIWRGIRELGRGNALVQQGTQFVERSVWRPNLDRRDRYKSAEEIDEAFRKHLFDAVRSSLRSPGPLLCDLSGGFDSSTVCAVASLLIQAGECRGPIVGWCFTNGRSNETTFQEAMRRQYSIDSHSLDLAAHPPFRCLPDTEIPLGSFIQAGSVNRVTREFAASRGIRSRLTGQAADALFQKGGSGAPVYLAEWIREGRLRDWYRHFRGYLQKGSHSASLLLRQCTWGTLDLHAGWRAPVPEWISPHFRDEIKEARYEFLHTLERAFRSDARERVYRWTLCFIPYPGGSLPEQRVPLAHRPLVEFLLGLEWEHLVSPDQDRVLMRRSLQNILPEAVRSGQRCWTAFGAGLYEGLRTAWPNIASLVTGERLAELGVVEPKKFRLAIEAMRGGYQGADPAIGKVALYLETWLGLKAALRAQPMSADGLRNEPIRPVA